MPKYMTERPQQHLDSQTMTISSLLELLWHFAFSGEPTEVIPTLRLNIWDAVGPNGLSETQRLSQCKKKRKKKKPGIRSHFFLNSTNTVIIRGEKNQRQQSVVILEHTVQSSMILSEAQQALHCNTC